MVLVCRGFGLLVFVGLLARCFAGFLVSWLSVRGMSGPTGQGTVAERPKAVGYVYAPSCPPLFWVPRCAMERERAVLSPAMSGQPRSTGHDYRFLI